MSIKDRVKAVIRGVYEKFEQVKLNPKHFSINLCLACEGLLSQEIYGYTNFVVSFEGMLITAVIKREECILCQR